MTLILQITRSSVTDGDIVSFCVLFHRLFKLNHENITLKDSDVKHKHNW